MSASVTEDDLIIRRSFDAPASLLFALWSDPRHMRQWMGPNGLECREATVDFRVGGAYRAMILSAAQNENWFGGVYREIEQDKRLVFTFAWDNDGPVAGIEMLVTILFEEHNGKTTQTFHQTLFPTTESRDNHRGGWTAVFDRMHDYITKLTKEQN